NGTNLPQIQANRIAVTKARCRFFRYFCRIYRVRIVVQYYQRLVSIRSLPEPFISLIHLISVAARTVLLVSRLSPLNRFRSRSVAASRRFCTSFGRRGGCFFFFGGRFAVFGLRRNRLR